MAPLTNLQSGHVVLFPDALTEDVNNSSVAFDLLITILEVSDGTAAINTNPGRMVLTGDREITPFVRYTISFVEPGSATTTNPEGVAVTLRGGFVFEIQDLDSAGLTNDLTDFGGVPDTVISGHPRIK